MVNIQMRTDVGIKRRTLRWNSDSFPSQVLAIYREALFNPFLEFCIRLWQIAFRASGLKIMIGELSDNIKKRFAAESACAEFRIA